MHHLSIKSLLANLVAVLGMVVSGVALAAPQPKVVLIILDNTGWGDFGPYGGGELRGAPSSHINKLALEGLNQLQHRIPVHAQ